jgi:hypothetical protein
MTCLALVKASHNIFSEVSSALPEKAVVEQKPGINGFYDRSTNFKLSLMQSVTMAKILGKT